MPEPTPATPSAHPPAQHPDASTSPPPRPRAVGWLKVLFVIGIAAITLCLAMFLFLHAHRAVTLPTWPLHASDVLPLTPGDANIAKWAQDPSSTGFIVQLLDAHGNPLHPPTFCALEPDYMADAQQPGGTLTLVAQQPAGAWSVRWSGGNTVPPFLKSAAHFEANCGKSATVLMSPEQLHAFLDILNGISMVTPPPPTQTH